MEIQNVRLASISYGRYCEIRDTMDAMDARVQFGIIRAAMQAETPCPACNGGKGDESRPVWDVFGEDCLKCRNTGIAFYDLQ